MTANEIDGRGVGVSKRMLRSLQAKPCFIAKRLPDQSRGILTTNAAFAGHHSPEPNSHWIQAII